MTRDTVPAPARGHTRTMFHLSMKTFDFGARQPEARREHPATSPSDVEDGWRAYATWLEGLREQADESRAPLPAELFPIR